MIDFFRSQPAQYSTQRCIRLAKFVQHVIAPSLARAFDTHDADAVVGAPPAPTAPEADQDERSIVWQFCRYIIDPYYKRHATTSQLPVPVPLRVSRETAARGHRFLSSHSLRQFFALQIALYSLCALLVQRCSHHIHEAKQRENGVCLILFMLFGWPCQQPQYQGGERRQQRARARNAAHSLRVADLMEKYSGQYLLASLIDKFTINRKIIIQVSEQT